VSTLWRWLDGIGLDPELGINQITQPAASAGPDRRTIRTGRSRVTAREMGRRRRRGLPHTGQPLHPRDNPDELVATAADLISDLFHLAAAESLDPGSCSSRRSPFAVQVTALIPPVRQGSALESRSVSHL
jgi:hypothetical protein